MLRNSDFSNSHSKEEVKFSKVARIQQKVGDMSVMSHREEEEDTLSFLQIENQIKKQNL